jgi:nucleotide-binding universal stress UspA family protein
MRYCRNFARGIISAAAERKADLLIMGWQGHRQQEFSLGSTVDPVLERATCNVAVFKDCQQRKYRNVLVPYAGGPNATFSLEVASIMVDKDEGRVVVLNVAPPGKPTQNIDMSLHGTVSRSFLRKPSNTTWWSSGPPGIPCSGSGSWDLSLRKLPGIARNPSSWSKPNTPSSHLSRGGCNASIEQ